MNLVVSIIVSVFIGLIIGYFLARLTRGGAHAVKALKEAEHKLDQQKKELKTHFSETANLLKNVAEDYQKLQQHMAQTSVKLLPESVKTPLFNNEQLNDRKSIKQDKNNSIIIANKDNDDSMKGNRIDKAISTDINKNEHQQPRDYSGNASGILKAKH